MTPRNGTGMQLENYSSLAVDGIQTDHPEALIEFLSPVKIRLN